MQALALKHCTRSSSSFSLSSTRQSPSFVLSKNILAVNAKAGYIAGSYKLRQAFLFIFAELSLRQSRKLRRLFGSVFFLYRLATRIRRAESEAGFPW